MVHRVLAGDPKKAEAMSGAVVYEADDPNAMQRLNVEDYHFSRTRHYLGAR